MSLEALKAELVALRAERDSLLLKDRRTKSTKRHQERYRQVTSRLNEIAAQIRLRIGGTSV